MKKFSSDFIFNDCFQKTVNKLPSIDGEAIEYLVLLMHAINMKR